MDSLRFRSAIMRVYVFRRGFGFLGFFSEWFLRLTAAGIHYFTTVSMVRNAHELAFAK
jgi:hypothetical protein